MVCLATEGCDEVQVISTLCQPTFNEMFCIQQRLQLLTESYLENGEEPFTVDILKEMTSKYLACVFLIQVVLLNITFVNIKSNNIVDSIEKAW